MGAIAAVLNEFQVSSPLLARVFFTSLELCLLAPLLVFGVKLNLIRSHRIHALLWLVIMTNALAGLMLPAPYGITPWQGSDLSASPTQPAPVNRARSVVRERLGEARLSETPAAAPSPSQGLLVVPPGVAPPPPVVAVAPAWWRGVSLLNLLLAAWLGGAGLMLGCLALERWRLHTLLRRTSAPSPALLAQYDEETANFSRRWRPRLRVTRDLETPAIVGVVRPVVLVPQWLEAEGTPDQWSWTLRHELTHWRHGDTAGQMLRLIVQALLFFHPCVWWAGKQWEEAAEMACDRSLLKSESDAVGYAKELCTLLGMIGKRQRPLMSAGLFASRSHIGRRIETLLADPLSRPARLRMAHRAMVILALVGVLSVDLGSASARGKTITPTSVPVITALAASSGSTTAPNARVLQFPEDYSMGTLSIDGQQVEARGTINVPPGASVQLRVNEAGAADLSPLAGFGADDIQSLSFRNTGVQNEQLAYIQDLTGLTSLSLWATPVSDEGMRYLSGLTQIDTLILNSTAVGDEGMQYLSGLVNIRELDLNRTQVGDEGLAYIQSMTSLEDLDMWMIDITDEGLQYLAGLTNLRVLGMEDTLISDAGLRYLEGLQQLTELNLENNNITDAGLASLMKLPNLAEVILADTYITDAGMALLALFPSLREAILPPQIGPDGKKLLAGTLVGDSIASATKPTRAVTVKITGEGKPLPSAHFLLVEVLDPTSEEVHVYRTDATGSARLYLPERDVTYRLRGFAEGYVTNEEAWAAPTPTELRLDLARATFIGGVVVDTAGAPVSGVSVSVPVLGAHNWDSQEALPHSVITDEAGRWTCDVAPKELGDFWVSLAHPDYATTTYTMADLSVASLRDGNETLAISNAIGMPGIVVDDAGAPVAGARLSELEPWRQGGVKPTGRAAVADTTGSFEIRPIQPGESLLRVDAVGYPTLEETVTVAAGMAPVRIVLSKGKQFRGRAVSLTGEALPDLRVRVSARSKSGVDLGSKQTQTDNEGRFVWADAPKGPYHILFSNETEHHQEWEVAASDEEQVFKVPFAGAARDIKAGQALIDRYNQAHAPETMGNLVFLFTTKENFGANAAGKVVKYAGSRMADGRYTETLSFGVEGDEKLPWRHSWNGTTYVRHGHPAPGDAEEGKETDAARYFVGDTMEEPAHLVALDWLVIFVRAHSYTRRYPVTKFENGVVNLGADGKTFMTMHFPEPGNLHYDHIEYFDEQGRNVFTVEASDWSDYNGVPYPTSATGRYNQEGSQGVSEFNIELIAPMIPQVPEIEIMTLEIPSDALITYGAAGERKEVSAGVLDAELLKKRAYLEAITAKDASIEVN